MSETIQIWEEFSRAYIYIIMGETVIIRFVMLHMWNYPEHLFKDDYLSLNTILNPVFLG